MENNELLQAIGEMLNPIIDKLDKIDSRLDKVDARLDKVKCDVVETRISILALDNLIKYTIPRDIHSISDEIIDIKQFIKNITPENSSQT